VGTVAELGPGTSGKFSEGQRVVGAPFPTVQGGGGTWQQYILAKEGDLVAVPDAVSDDTAAQVRRHQLQPSCRLRPPARRRCPLASCPRCRVLLCASFFTILSS
jgi:hypothetical protein